MKEILTTIVRGETLSAEQAAGAMRVIMQGGASDIQVAGLLVGLATRSESITELTALSRVMREFFTPVACDDPHAIDMCGTGGDGLGTFNISTTASFVCAGAGVTVAKHGNVGVSSRCGSADVLRALGINLDLSAPGVSECLGEVGIGFIFARHFHPAMRYVMPARRALGVRTCFNILGPLCNPAGVARQVVGAFSIGAAKKMAAILKNLGAVHIITVSSEGGMDEFSLQGRSSYREFRAGWAGVRDGACLPQDFSLASAPVSALAGGDVTKNARLLRAVLSGAPGPHRDVVLLNSAFGLLVSGRFEDLDACFAAARESIDSGAAMARLAQLQAVSQRLP